MFAPQLVALFGGDLGGTVVWEEVWHWRQAGHPFCVFLAVKNVSSVFYFGCHGTYLIPCPSPMMVMDSYTSVTVGPNKSFLLQGL